MSVTVDVRDLVGNPGARRALHLEEPVAGLRTGLAAVPEDVPVDAELLLESLVDGVLVSGAISGTLVESCARCLKPLERPFHLDVQELFAPDAAPDDPEGYPLGDGTMDLEPMIRDAVLLSMPYSPLCRPDCLGLCERCGGDRNLGECTCQPEPDARWAVLGSLQLPDEIERTDRRN